MSDNNNDAKPIPSVTDDSEAESACHKNAGGKNENLKYEVGYGKPPKATRFKSGKSGNPSGKKKPRPGVVDQVNAALNQKITVTEGGKKRRLTKQQVMLTTLANNAAQGDLKAAAFLLKLKETYQDKNTETIDPSALDMDDQSIIDNFLKQSALGEEVTISEDCSNSHEPNDDEVDDQSNIDASQQSNDDGNTN